MDAAEDREERTIKQPLTPEQQARQRQRQGLLLTRARILKQMEGSQNQRYSEQLQAALAEIDARLQNLS